MGIDPALFRSEGRREPRAASVETNPGSPIARLLVLEVDEVNTPTSISPLSGCVIDDPDFIESRRGVSVRALPVPMLSPATSLATPSLLPVGVEEFEELGVLRDDKVEVSGTHLGLDGYH